MPHRKWQQANAAFPDRSTAGHLFATQAGPVLRQAEADGTIGAWFFLRSPAASATFLNALASATPSLTWTSVVCELEPHAFGGGPAMAAGCELFHADSRHLLDWLPDPHRPLGQRETSALLCGALLRGAGLDWFEQGDVWARVSALRLRQPAIPAGHSEDLHRAMRTLMAADTKVICDPAHPGPLSGYHGWITAFDRAGQSLARLHRDGQLTRGLRAVLAHHLIFHFNRAGLTGTEQATMATLACNNVFHDRPPGVRNLLESGGSAPQSSIAAD
jgi:protein-L-isoaspartate(D-aspartate) O-methyltransferase